MKKLVLAAAALAMTAGSAFAADLPLKAPKAPPPAPFDPWDIAFGAGVMNDYIFRGVTQSNHKPSVTAYFEPRYNVNKDLQLYIGTSTESISFANRAAAEVDVYGGIRPTFGAAAFDFGVWGYLYPGGNALDRCGNCPAGSEIASSNGNVMKKDVSFFEGYAKLNYTINDSWQWRIERILLAELPELGRLGQLRVDHRQVHRAQHGVRHQRRRHVRLRRVRPAVARHVRCILRRRRTFPAGIQYASYNTWNIGIGFTYKVFTLDLRYSDTDLSKGDCNAFTSAFNASGTTNVTPINPGGVGSNWCGAAGIAKLSVDLTAMTNLK